MIYFNDIQENFEYPDAKTIEWKGQQIFIKQYLPLSRKYTLLYSVVGGLFLDKEPYNPLLGEALFDLEIVKEYTNINFDDVSESYFKQFDVLHINGIVDLVIENIPKEEYEEIQRLYHEIIKSSIDYYSTLGTSIRSLLDNVPNLEDEVENLDMEAIEKAQEVIEKLSKEKHI